MGLENTFEVTLKVYVDTQAYGHLGAAEKAEEEVRRALRKANVEATIKTVDTRQTTEYR